MRNYFNRSLGRANRTLRRVGRYFGNNDIDIIEPEKLTRRLELHQQTEDTIRNYENNEIQRREDAFNGNERLQHISKFVEEISVIDEVRHRIIQTAKENAYVIWDGNNFKTCNKEKYDEHVENPSENKRAMLNNLVPMTRITYQELGLLLDSTLATQIINELNPEYLESRGASVIHSIFRLLPIETITNLLNSYYEDECSISKSVILLKKKMLKILNKSELTKFSNNTSNKLMVDSILDTFSTLEESNTVENYASNYRINIINYFCTLVRFFNSLEKTSRDLCSKWTELFIGENIGAKNIEDSHFPTLCQRGIDKNDISCESGIIKRFSTSLGLAISPVLPTTEEIIDFENFKNKNIRTPAINELRESLNRIALNNWYQTFIEENGDKTFTIKGLSEAWNELFSKKWNDSNFVKELGFPQYEEIKNQDIIKQVYDKVFDIIKADYEGYILGGKKSRRKINNFHKLRKSQKMRKFKHKYYLK
jgi:hypothetical protein